MKNDIVLPLANPFTQLIRHDIPGRFNEVDLLKKQWARIQNALNGNILPPYEILIHPSSACNLCCAWCIGDHVPIQTKNREGLPIFLDASKTSTRRLPDTLADPDTMIRMIQGILDYKKIGTYFDGEQKHEHEFRVENVSFSGLIGEPLVFQEGCTCSHGPSRPSWITGRDIHQRRVDG